jgi:hypothetical protein
MAHTPGRNPFRPGVGIRPPYLAGRDAPLRRFEAMLRAAPEQPPNMKLTGLRGVGKTVLLKEFAERAVNAGWAAASSELSPSHNTDKAITTVLLELAERARHSVSRTERAKAAVGAAIQAAGRIGATWNDITFTVQPGVRDHSEAALAKVLFDATEFVVGKGYRGLLLLLDEAQIVRDEKERRGEHPLSLIVSAFVALQRQEVPIGLVLCGLPTLSGNLLRARSYTERMFRGEVIGGLDKREAEQALTEPLRGGPITATQEVVSQVVREVEGYPYFVQLWGAELWEAAHRAESATITDKLLEVTEPDIHHRLDNDFYEPRISTLTPAEQDLLLATAHSRTYPPLLVSEINDVSEKSPGNINVLLGRMVEAGVLYRVRKGQYDYTAPKFRNYLRRRQRRDSSESSR